MENINFNGVHVSILKYKVRIFDPKNEISEEQAVSIVSYLFKEGFISKQEFPVEIVGTEE